MQQSYIGPEIGGFGLGKEIIRLREHEIVEAYGDWGDDENVLLL